MKEPADIWEFKVGFNVNIAVFSLTLARSPMASRFYRRASDFLNYSPRLASDILAEAEQKSGKKRNFTCF